MTKALQSMIEEPVLLPDESRISMVKALINSDRILHETGRGLYHSDSTKPKPDTPFYYSVKSRLEAHKKFLVEKGEVKYVESVEDWLTSLN